MIKLNSNKRISKKQLGGFLSDLVTQNAPAIVPKINNVLDSLFNRETQSRNFIPAKQVKVNPKNMKDLIEKRRALYGNGNTEYDKFEGITPDLKSYQETLNPEEKRLFSKYKDFYHVNEGLDANGNLMNIDVKKPQSKDAYDPEFDYDKNKGSCKGLGCYELIIDDNRDIIPKDKMKMIRRKSALNLDVIPENYDGIVDEFVNTGIARKLKDRNEPFDIKKHSQMVNEAMKRGDKVFWQKIYQGKDSDFVAGHSGYFTQPYNREDGSQQGLVTFASEGDGLNANHYYDFQQDKRSLDAMGIAIIPKKKKQLGGNTIKSDDRNVLERFLDEKTKPVRDLGRMYSETAKKGYETFDRNYPTVSDKASAITALTSLIPHPAVKYGSMGANVMLDLLNLENDDNKAELAALYLNQIPKLAGKKINLASHLLTGVTSLNSDILPKDAKLKKFPKK